MKWVKADRVKLDDDKNIAHRQIKEAIAERFPVAWDFLIGKFDIDDNRLATELKLLFQFMADNWNDSSRESAFDYEEWKYIFQALRYAAEEIGYLPQTKALDMLRDGAKKLSGKLLQMNVVGGLSPKDLQYEDLPIYPGDWLTMLQAMYFAVRNIKDDNADPCMRELKLKINKLAPVVANRVKHHEIVYWQKCGLSELNTEKRLEEMTVMPWDRQKHLKKKGLKAVEGEYGYVEVVPLPLDQIQGVDPKEEFESRKKFEGEPPTYPKDMEGICGVDYKLMTGWELGDIIENGPKEENKDEEQI